jgi:hypothetical protein
MIGKSRIRLCISIRRYLAEMTFLQLPPRQPLDFQLSPSANALKSGTTSVRVPTLQRRALNFEKAISIADPQG